MICGPFYLSLRASLFGIGVHFVVAVIFLKGIVAYYVPQPHIIAFSGGSTQYTPSCITKLYSRDLLRGIRMVTSKHVDDIRVETGIFLLENEDRLQVLSPVPDMNAALVQTSD
jgi:hypothetical protein